MPVTTVKVPVEFNVYYPTGANNPYLKNNASYTNQTYTDNGTSNITEGGAAALTGHTNIYYQTHTAGASGLTQSTEVEVFSKTFAASTGYYYTTFNGFHIFYISVMFLFYLINVDEVLVQLIIPGQV